MRSMFVRYGSGRCPAEIVIIVRHRRSDVVVSVDDDRLAVNLKRALPESLVARLGEQWDEINRAIRQNNKQIKFAVS